MSESQESQTPNRVDRPGKTRTWWHPLLARLLDHVLATAYTVRDEVLVGKLPLRVDILLIRREAGELPEVGRRDLSVLVPLLNRFTLIEFKGPTDALEPGDVAQLLGCSFLWHSQQVERVAVGDITLIVLAPIANDALSDELRSLGCQAREHEAGVVRIVGMPFTTWLVETDVMAARGQPVLSLVSRVFLRDHERIIGELLTTGHAPLVYYVLQQVQQFRKQGEGFAMQHSDTEYLGQLEEKLQAAVLEAIPVEKRLQGLSPEDRVQGLSPEDRVQGLSPEDRVQGLSPQDRIRGLLPEELVTGLSEEQAARLREFLERKQGH